MSQNSKEEKELLNNEELTDVVGGVFENQFVEPSYKEGDILLSSDGGTKFEITRIGERDLIHGYKYYGNEEVLLGDKWHKITNESFYNDVTLQNWTLIN